jgi:hypothetical protein
MPMAIHWRKFRQEWCACPARQTTTPPISNSLLTTLPTAHLVKRFQLTVLNIPCWWLFPSLTVVLVHGCPKRLCTPAHSSVLRDILADMLKGMIGEGS